MKYIDNLELKSLSMPIIEENNRYNLGENPMADNTRGLITTKQTKFRPVASAAPHSITLNSTGGEILYFGGGGNYRSFSKRRYQDPPTHVTPWKNP